MLQSAEGLIGELLAPRHIDLFQRHRLIDVPEGLIYSQRPPTASPVNW